MKRFWTAVDVTDDQGIMLDGKPVRTPGRVPLLLPNAALAEAVADEWRAVEGEIDPRAMPLTGLANAAIDRIAPDPRGFAAGLAAYAESDLLCYRADSPATLVARQAAAWDPLLDWARANYGVDFVVTTGIMHQHQPPATIARLHDAIAARDAFELAALAPVVTISGSLVAALALAERAAEAEAVWLASELDSEWQAEQWGEDDLAIPARKARRRDYEAGVRLLELLR
ncbi:MAG: ATPase [Sphingomonas sp.]|nr:ATPase [Sphingomonas sp.]